MALVQKQIYKPMGQNSMPRIKFQYTSTNIQQGSQDYAIGKGQSKGAGKIGETHAEQ